MKKLLVLVSVIALLHPAVAPAAGKKPVATTLFAHGTHPLGELDGVEWAAATFPQKSPLTLDAEEPGGAEPKSMTFASPYINSECTGSPLAYPSFEGNISGTIKGDIELTAHFLAAPGKVTARLWVDTTVFNCNDAYIEPNIEVEFDVPAGQNEVVVKLPNKVLKAQQLILLQVLVEDIAQGYQGQFGRVLYDSTDTPTRLEFTCVPTSGTSCVP